MKRILLGAVALHLLATGFAAAQDIKIALISSRTGPLEAYATQTEAGFTLGLEYLTGGTMSVNGHKLVVVSKDDQGKPDLAKTLLEQAYADDNADIAVGTSSSGAALAMLPVAQDQGKVLFVEPAFLIAVTAAEAAAMPPAVKKSGGAPKRFLCSATSQSFIGFLGKP